MYKVQSDALAFVKIVKWIYSLKIKKKKDLSTRPAKNLEEN